MAKTIAQKALCLPVSAGRTILPVCSWRLFPRSSAPILHVCLEGKIIGDIKPRETRAPSLSPVLQEEKGLPATADCALLHPISLPPVQYTCSSSFEKPCKEQTSFSLHSPAPLTVWKTVCCGILGVSPGPVPSSASTRAEIALYLLPTTS